MTGAKTCNILVYKINFFAKNLLILRDNAWNTRLNIISCLLKLLPINFSMNRYWIIEITIFSIGKSKTNYNKTHHDFPNTIFLIYFRKLDFKILMFEINVQYCSLLKNTWILKKIAKIINKTVFILSSWSLGVFWNFIEIKCNRFKTIILRGNVIFKMNN